MTQQVAYRFLEALALLEQQGELEPIIDLFTEGCEIGDSLNPDKLRGHEGAREFWNRYRTMFRDVRSTVRNIVIGDNSIALEWTATGANGHGRQFRYDGVSILDTVGNEITRFRAYFDTRQLGEQISQAARVTAMAH